MVTKVEIDRQPRETAISDREVLHAIHEVAEDFGGSARDTTLFENIEKHRYECSWILDSIGETGSVFDLGGGLGVNLLVVRRLRPRATLKLADRFDEYTPDNRMGAKSRGLELMRAANIDVIEQDFWNEPTLPFEDGQIDAVTFLDVVEHLPGHPLRQLAEVRRILRPGGRLLLAGPNAASLRKRFDILFGRHPYTPFEEWVKDFYYLHIREYTREEYVQLLRLADFEGIQRRMSHDVWVTRSRHRYWRRPRSALSPVVGALYGMRFAEALLPALRHTVYCSAEKPTPA